MIAFMEFLFDFAFISVFSFINGFSYNNRSSPALCCLFDCWFLFLKF